MVTDRLLLEQPHQSLLVAAAQPPDQIRVGRHAPLTGRKVAGCGIQVEFTLGGGQGLALDGAQVVDKHGETRRVLPAAGDHLVEVGGHLTQSLSQYLQRLLTAVHARRRHHDPKQLFRLPGQPAGSGRTGHFQRTLYLVNVIQALAQQGDLARIVQKGLQGVQGPGEVNLDFLGQPLEPAYCLSRRQVLSSSESGHKPIGLDAAVGVAFQLRRSPAR